MNTAKATPNFSFTSDKIPDTLKAAKRWAPWRAVFNSKRGKWDKIPAHAVAPYYGISTARPERWYSYGPALAALASNPDRFAGLGYVMTGPHGIVGIDLDRCVEANTIAPWALEVIKDLNSYTELSPTGTGIRIIVQGSVNSDWTNHDVGIEVYGGHQPRFLTITGQRLKMSPETVNAPGDDVLLSLELAYAKASTSATVITLALPEIVEADELPDIDSLALPPAVERFLRTGEHGGDRSRALFAASVGLFNAGLDDSQALSFLYHNPHAMEVALDHRRQDSDRALMYLWVEHCQKGKTKSTPVAAMADFEMLAPEVLPETPPEPAQSGEPDEVQGSADDFDAVDDAPPTPALPPEPKAKGPRFEVMAADDFASGPPPTWIVKNLLPKAELCVLFGESGSGKSFIALDIAAAIARGTEWRGLRVKQGRVVYIAAEGAGGFRNRMKAYAQGHELPLKAFGNNFGVISAAPNFMVKDDALDVCKAILAGGPASVVIVDTFAQVMPGANENAGEDVGKALQHCKGIHKATGALVVLVHHAGKDSTKGARGWSGLRAAADAEIEVVRGTTGRLMRTSKQKDGVDGLQWGFDLAAVPVGVDEDGDVITSCVVTECAVPDLNAKVGRPKNTGVWGARVLEVLTEMALVQSAGIEPEAVVSEVVRRSPDDGSDPTGKVRRRLAKRTLKQILDDENGSFYEEDGAICVV